MVNIKPFKGLRFNKEKVQDFRLVITPPYDVINEEQKQEFLGNSQYNMVRLLLGNPEDNYKDVAQTFQEWLKEEVLKQDQEDSIYIYSQTFKNNGNSVTRTGFISLVELEELGKSILPHEKTLEKPFRDRLALLEATKANFGCVFILYDDREKKIDKIISKTAGNKQPDMEFDGQVGINHKLWKLNDSSSMQKIQQEMKQYQCVIADGHHRYKSTCRFKELHPELEDAKHTMCCFINSFNGGLLVLPIDRFVFNLEDSDVGKILEQIKEHFEVEEIDDPNKLVEKLDKTEVMIDKTSNLKNHVFGMYSFLNKRSYFLKLKDNNILDPILKECTDVYKKLDINILHKIIFEKILKISEEDQYKGAHIEYTKQPTRAIEKLKDSKYQFAFFLNPPLMREIFLTARADETMPQKSTYFYPKVYSGLVINKINK